jgi:hypothetical protein
MDDQWTENLFDEKKIKKAINRGKKRSVLTIVFVSIGVFILLSIGNFAISVYFSQKAYKQWDAYVRLSTPNGYISETVDSIGILGGASQYKISKDMKIKSIVTDQKQYFYGLIPSLIISRGAGGGIGVTGEDWQFSYKENGWKEMLFFHPKVSYKKYMNDENLIQRMDGDHIFEVALSFDQPYKVSELPFRTLPKMTWFWIDTYSRSQLQAFQQEAKEYDWSATSIREKEALGFSFNDSYTSLTNLEFEYDEFLGLLKTSIYSEHVEAYDQMKEYQIDEVDIIGIVVYGTKDEIKEWINNPAVTASSLGGVIDNY